MPGLRKLTSLRRTFNQHSLLALALLLVAVDAAADSAEPLRYELLQRKPHNFNSFTQGLAYDGGSLLESSGLYRRSFIYEYDADTGKVLNKHRLPDHLFAEGLTQLGEHVYVLTWKKQTLLKFNRNTLRPIASLTYEGEGWGLADDESHLWMSNGTHLLTKRDPDTFSILQTLAVTDNGKPLSQLNELEYAQGFLWANVWQQNFIAQIDLSTGQVIGKLDLSALVAENSLQAGHTVLNGIAYNAKTATFWVTGKFWPSIYELKIQPAATPIAP